MRSLLNAAGPVRMPGEEAGAVVSTTHEWVLGVPMFPASSISATWNEWVPSARAGGVNGLVQAAHAPPSTLHT